MGFLVIVIILLLIIRLAKRINPQAYTLRNREKRILSRLMLQKQQQNDDQFEALKNVITLSISFRNIFRRVITEFSSLDQLYIKENTFSTADFEDINTLKKKLDSENKNLVGFIAGKSKNLSPLSRTFVNELKLIVTENISVIEDFQNQDIAMKKWTPFLSDCLMVVNEKQHKLEELHKDLVHEFQKSTMQG